MTTLTKNEPRAFEQGDSQFYPVDASTTIYEGAAVGNNAGYSRPLQAGDVFQGIAVEMADNSAGSAGDARIEVRTKGRARLTVAGATAITANALVAVYASDDNAFTTTAGSNSLIGYIAQYLASTDCVVEFDASLVRAALQA